VLLPHNRNKSYCYCALFRRRGIQNLSSRFFRHGTWTQFSGYMNFQKSGFWATANPHNFRKCPCGRDGLLVRSVTSQIMGSLFLEKIMSAPRHSSPYLHSSAPYRNFTKRDWPLPVERPQQRYVVWRNLSGIGSERLWPAKFLNLTSADFPPLKKCAYRTAREHTAESEHENAIGSITAETVLGVSENMACRIDACVENNGGCYHRVVWPLTYYVLRSL
jgi:hypothetical protein